MQAIRHTLALGLGLSTATLAAEMTEFGGLGLQIQPATEGWQVVRVVPGTPAAAAGIQSGDLLLKAEGFSLRGESMESTLELLRGQPGTVAELQVQRGSGYMEFNVQRQQMRLVEAVPASVGASSDWTAGRAVQKMLHPDALLLGQNGLVPNSEVLGQAAQQQMVALQLGQSLEQNASPEGTWRDAWNAGAQNWTVLAADGRILGEFDRQQMTQGIPQSWQGAFFRATDGSKVWSGVLQQ
jgi:hypothetical protein